MNTIHVQKIEKTYRGGSEHVHALRTISFKVRSGEMVAITGPSGSGKSTLMNIIGLIDRPTAGRLSLFDEEIKMTFSDRKLAQIRAEKIGFVFQTFVLLPKMSAYENVLLPARYCSKSFNYRERAQDLLEQMGLSHRLDHIPARLSGGEKQRVAIARALINDPELLLADEPTGNLDYVIGDEIIRIFRHLNGLGKTVVLITHDYEIAEQCDRIITLKPGWDHRNPRRTP